MTEQEVLAAIKEGFNAPELLKDANPNLVRRFNGLCSSLQKFITDVRVHFPDAEYYSASGTFCLLLGQSHTREGSPQQDLVALTGTGGLIIDGGDW